MKKSMNMAALLAVALTTLSASPVMAHEHFDLSFNSDCCHRAPAADVALEVEPSPSVHCFELSLTAVDHTIDFRSELLATYTITVEPCEKYAIEDFTTVFSRELDAPDEPPKRTVAFYSYPFKRQAFFSDSPLC